MIEEVFQAVRKFILSCSVSQRLENYVFFFVRFFSDELKQFPKEFRKILKLEGNEITCRKFLDNSYYEIGFFRYGYEIEASGNSLKEAKNNFIEQVNLKYGKVDNVRGMASTVVRGLQNTEFTTE